MRQERHWLLDPEAIDRLKETDVEATVSPEFHFRYKGLFCLAHPRCLQRIRETRTGRTECEFSHFQLAKSRTQCGQCGSPEFAITVVGPYFT